MPFTFNPSSPDVAVAVRAVYTLAQLDAAIDRGDKVITVAGVLSLTSSFEIPSDVVIKVAEGALIVQSASFTLTFNGCLDHPRVAFFSGFTRGQIIGFFGGEPVLPEWWGLTDNHHDIAINCAVGTNLVGGAYGKVVSLGARTYNTSRPIDCSGRSIRLIGPTSSTCMIVSASTWEGDTFFDSGVWNGGVLQTAVHTALIIIGGQVAGGADYFSGVEGITINGYSAMLAYPTKRVSCISSLGGLQEQTIIRDVVGIYFSGFGFGIADVGTGDPEINGLSINNFWFYGASKADSYGIYSNSQTSVFAIRDGTIDFRVGKEDSASHAVVDGNPVTGAPPFIFTRPIFGIYIGGKHVDIKNVHIEGVTVAIALVEGNSLDGADIASIDVNHLMDRGMVYTQDPARTAGPAPTLATQADEFLDSCIVLLCVPPGGSVGAVKSHVTVRNLYSAGWCKFFLRDPGYGVHESTYGRGPTPNEESGLFTSYKRSDHYGLPVGIWSDGSNFTVDTGTDVITTSTTHGLVVGQLWYPKTGSTLPTSSPQIVAGTGYYVKTTPSGTTLTISATLGGATIDFTTTGSGTHTWQARMVAGSLWSGVETDKPYFDLMV